MKWNIKELYKEYAPPEGDDLIFTDETPRTIILKRILNELPTYDKTILLMYAEIGSLREVARELDVSLAAVSKKIGQIQMKIMGRYYEEKALQLNKDIERKMNNDTGYTIDTDNTGLHN